MPEGGFFTQTHNSPTSLAIVILLHGTAITALALSKMEVVRPLFPRTVVTLIPNRTDPKPEVQKAPEPPKHASVIKAVRPVVPTNSDATVTTRPTEDVIPFDTVPGNDVVSRPVEPIIVPLPPVRTSPRIDSASPLQPPYPIAEERAGREGSVTVRLRIGPDGRVRDVEKLRAASDAFWRATERQALRYWRFRPATLDGRPIESDMVITVTFQLKG